MLSRQITHQNILRVLIGGFSLVILLLVAAALIATQNIRSIRESAASMVREQAVTNRLIDELHRQQTSLAEVFSLLARDPDSVDYDRIVSQLDSAGKEIDRIAAEGAKAEDSPLWARLKQASDDFSREARRLLDTDNVETYASVDLFRLHEAFISVVARLIENEYRTVAEAQKEIDAHSSRVFATTQVFGGASLALALLFAILTVRLVTQLIRGLEWQTAELGRVSWHMLQDQEATARRFSHELHDELGQSLTAIKANLSALEQNGHSRRVEDCLRVVDEAIGNVRQMSQLLRPIILDDFGLEASLRWLCEGFSARTGIDVRFNSSYSGRLSDETETHLFRIAQEALTNIARHAGAKHVDITLQSLGEEIVLRIADDGSGMPTAPPATARPRGHGMIGMRARARSAGGDLEVRSRPGEGVLIEVRAPIRYEAHTNSAG